MRFAPAVGITPSVAPYALYIVERVLVDNRVMGIFKNNPFALVYIMAFLVLKMLAGLEVASVTEILPLFEDMNDCGRTPTVT